MVEEKSSARRPANGRLESIGGRGTVHSSWSCSRGAWRRAATVHEAPVDEGLRASTEANDYNGLRTIVAVSRVAVRRPGMDFGINVDFAVRRGDTHEGSFQESFALVDLAESMGLDTVWLGEGHFRPGRSVLSAPIVVASAIASRTKRLRVGMAVQVLPLIHPLRIAEEAATVDQISQGRFEFGIGRSGNVRAYDIMGIDYS